MVINVDPDIKTRVYDSGQVTKGYVNKLKDRTLIHSL